MALDKFTDPFVVYLVRIADCTADAKEGTKPDVLVYSRVTDILKIELR
ncbi:hypothetical protein SBA5_110006 [Candidatus Sulfotelmatomonas gaucii]|uniref:Uncharacterized protein n=1 Tax=Candidatus Sulfuritelmatomonas gaucii TaxID=2043161 RepID=A0A2N9L2U4_9BACT|nr:hypothetical protein SBA5_110006 [Candidatus Sulfotelmatomonas gaucii]